MKNFEQIKNGVGMQLLLHIKNAENSLNNNKDDLNNFITECTSYLKNLDEVTKIVIGKTTNNIIKYIVNMYNSHSREYYDNFENFLAKYVFNSEQLKYKCIDCLRLGITASELYCFKGINPVSGGDFFREFINSQLGTSIPMDGAVEQAKKAYEEVKFSGDPVAKAEAYISLMDLKRDSGALQNDDAYIFYLLSTNELYQKSLSIVDNSNRKKTL